MKHVKKTLYLFLVLMILLLGCQGEDGDPGPQGEQGEQGEKGDKGDQGEKGALLSGNITGYVRVLGEFGKEVTDRSGITVTVDGSSPAKSAVTNAQGGFELTNVTEGIYLLVYTKSGYGTYKRFVIHSGGSVANFLSTVTMGQISSVAITDLALNFTSPSVLQVTGNYTAPVETNARLRLYLSTDANVSDKNYLLSVLTLNALAGTSFTVNFGFTGLITATNFEGVSSGTTIYVRAYLDNLESTYTDPVTGLTVYPSVGTGSNVATYVIP
jgi:hypothetical protein